MAGRESIVGRLLVLIGGNTAGLKRATADADRVLAGATRRLSSAGTALSLAITAPLVAAGVAVFRFGTQFEAAMTKSTAIIGNLSDEMRQKMSAAAKEVSKVSVFSATQAADSFFYLASAGLDARQSIAALPQVTKFAQAGAFDMARATDLLTDAQSALGLTVRDDVTKNLTNMARVSDVLVKANVLANASVEQFSESLTNKAGAALRAVGKDVEEGVAVLAAYADQGRKGADAGEQLNIVTRDLQKAANENASTFADLGVAVFDSAGEMRNYADIIGDIEMLLAGMSDEQKRATITTLGFQERSVSALITLLGTSDAIRRYEKELRAAGGTTDEVANRQLQSMQARLQLIRNRFQVAAIDLEEALVPALEKLADVLERSVKAIESGVAWFADLDDSTQDWIVTAVAAVAAIGPLLLAFAGISSVLGAVVGGFKALVAIGSVAGAVLAGLPPVAAVLLAGAAGVGAAALFAPELAGLGGGLGGQADGLANRIATENERNAQLRQLELGRVLGANRINEISQRPPVTTPELHGDVTGTAPDLGFLEEFDRVMSPEGQRELQQRAEDLFAARNELNRVFGELQVDTPPAAAEVDNLAMSEIELGENAAAVAEVLQNYQNRLGQLRGEHAVFGNDLETMQAQSNAARVAIQDLIALGFDPASLAIQNLSEQLLENRSIWELWAADTINLSEEVQTILFDTFQNIAAGIGQVVAQFIVYQEQLGKTAVTVLKQIAAQAIATLIKLGIEAIAQAIIRRIASRTEVQSVVGARAGEVYANVFSQVVSSIPIVGAVIAPGIAAAAAAALTGGAQASIAAGEAVQLEEGGIAFGRTLAEIGEGFEPEVVAPLSRVQQWLDFSGGRARGDVILDGRELADSYVRWVPVALAEEGIGP